ncbi:CaiB/BaiF CoA transferase family protein [Prescottella agglutinans]|uniref:Alpha-methylacyl-CoA racemase n=1 Tax=Prescottella agglutinans TaxID=1644129 RepID=A0ABT6MK57_9NOCA|nr:CaiB/BaiF CoA-transferase family protein [Prescottella agglutinans]MDH6284693.1 alpha-methylacyl-CoA racemase [Prescottella agglutinans]
MKPVLEGLRVVELAGIGPSPHAAMLLADLGADVVRIERPGGVTQLLPVEKDAGLRNRRSVGADLKDPEGLQRVLELVDEADVLIEGYRPGVAERLGIGPEVCRKRNRRLVYARITGWGQDGPLAHYAGHDINYLALTGALNAIGREGERPHAPLNLVADLGGGSMLAIMGILSALYSREQTGEGDVVDIAMVDGVSALMTMFWTLTENGLWSAERGTNVIDGAAPFYDTYECADGRHIAVGAVESPFYAQLLEGLGLDPADLPDQYDQAAWPIVRKQFAEVFRGQSRDKWVDTFAQLDACVTPVLALDEVSDHPHIAARHTVVESFGQRQPAAAPRFANAAPATYSPPRVPGADTDDVFNDWGVDDAD